MTAMAAAGVDISQAQATNPAFARLDGMAREAMVRHNVPGVSAGILLEGQEYAAGTLFQAGSITKTHTATAIMILVEQGKIELEALVRRYLLDLILADEVVAEQVTDRQLLNHTAGWFGDGYGPPPTDLEPTSLPA